MNQNGNFGGGNPPYGPPGAPPGYGAPPQGAPPGYGAPPQGAPPGYGAPPQGAPPGYGAPPQGAPPGYGAPPQGAPPGYGAPPQGAPPGYGAPPQGAPPGYGAPPQGAPPGYGAPPNYGAPPGYGPPGAPRQGNVNDPLGLSGAPTSPWVPTALISLFFPGLGLLMLDDEAMKPLGIKIFVGYLVISVAGGVFSMIMGLAHLYILSNLIGYFLYLLHPLAHIGAMIHTHDATVRRYPNLGQPIFFK